MPPVANRTIAEQPDSISETYSDTLKMIKTWLDTEETADLARLFSIGDLRTFDLLTACHREDDETASAAFLTLRLLGKSECEGCGDSISRKHNGLPFVCRATIADSVFKSIDDWLTKKRTPKGYECGDDPDPLASVGDSVVYALILDASPRSRVTLDRIRALEKACGAEDMIIGDVVKNAPSLIVAAKETAHNLNLDDKLEDTIRASAFFLPSEYRKDSKVELIARNKAGNRILLEISYRCGMLCGSGYYIALRKDGTVWQYDVIGMAWIS